jgi:preprotein translocase subunit SecE
MAFDIANWYRNAINFLRDVRIELGNVTWPERKDTALSTVVVIVTVFITALFLWLVDLVILWLISLITPS